MQAAVILATAIYGYGLLNSQVSSNTADIIRIEAEAKERNNEFIDKFDSFIKEQKELNRQIVRNTTNQTHILKKLELD